MGDGGGGYASSGEGGVSRKISAKNKKVILKKYLDKLKL
jgi:hypothetical protein